jgi:hypothetical protein
VRRALTLLGLAALLWLGSVAPARADWQFSPFFGYAFKGETSLVTPEVLGTLKVRWAIGGTVTALGRGPFGVEGIVLLVPQFFEAGNVGAVSSSRTYAVMGNAVLTAPRNWNEYGLRPFVSGGLGLMHATQNTTIPAAFPLDKNLLGYNVGGGAVGFLTDHTGLRFDLRYYSSLSRSEGDAFGPGRLRFWTGAVGVVLRY